MAGLPLEGVKILDFSWILIGPQCGQYLAAMGADIIKVESQAFPDQVRRNPLNVKDGIPGLNRSANFNAIHWGGKKSITLNLEKPEAIELVRELIRKWGPDVLMENFVVGTMKRRGLDYESVKAIKPDIVYCSMSLLGQTGPYAWHRGWGPTMQAKTGLSWLSGHPHVGKPIPLGGTYPDFTLAGFAAFAILLALWHRRDTEEGQHIDFAQNDVVISTITDALMDYTMNRREQKMRGNRDPLFVPQGVYRCSGMDNWVAISVANDKEWGALCQAMGRPGLAQDPRYAAVLDRSKHHDEIDQIITEWTVQHTNSEVQEILQDLGIAAGAVVDTEQLIQDPHLRARGFFLEIDHDEVGPSLYGGLPVHLGQGEPRTTKAPLFGQHNGEVFSTILGLSEAEIEWLVQERVVY